MNKVFFVLTTLGTSLSLSNSTMAMNLIPNQTEYNSNLMGFEVRPLLTTAGNPADYVISSSVFPSVARLSISRDDGNFICTGSLIADRYVLTAAHCLTDDVGNLTTNSVQAIFNPQTTLNSSNILIYPGWTGDLLLGKDIALIETSAPAPSDLPRYEIFTGNPANLFGSGVDKVGFGRSGNGNDGSILNAGTKRTGKNTYDNYADDLFNLDNFTGFEPFSSLLYDFDNGLEANDAFGVVNGKVNPDIGLSGTGLGLDEVSAAPGDSGGPTFTSALQIMGVTSYGLTLGINNGDIKDGVNSSFGEFAGDANVALYADWINEQIGATEIPEPSALLGLITVGFLGFHSGKKK